MPERDAALPGRERGLVTVCLTACFLLGALLGCLLAVRTCGQGEEILRRCLDSSILLGDAGIPALLWYGLRFLLLALLCGILSFRLVSLPLLLAVRGLILGFFFSLLFCVLGGAGLFWGICTAGVSAMLLEPCLFRIAVQALTRSRRRGFSMPCSFGTLAFCAAALTCHTLFLHYLAPLLLTWVGG